MAPLFSALILGCATLAAQDPVPAPDSPAPSAAITAAPRLLDQLQDGTPPPPAPPKPPFIVAPEHIRETKSIQQGGRTITLQRIDPIALPPPPTPAGPPTAEDRAAFAQRAAAFRAAYPRENFIQLGANLYLSEKQPPRALVRLWGQSGGEVISFWSNADFRLVAGLGRFADSTGQSHRLFLMWSVIHTDRTPALRAAHGRPYEPPAFPVFPGEDAGAPFDPAAVPGPATFVITGDAAATPAQLAAIDALHQVYNNERGRLHTAYQDREQARIAREAELKAHPPQPEDITVRYWLRTTAPEIPDPTPYLPRPAAPPSRPAGPPQPRRPRPRPRRTGFQPVMEDGLPACLVPSSICRHRAAVLLVTPLALLPARAALDSNNNGVSDIWEFDTNSGQLFTAFDPAADDDGDGWTNAQEEAAGTLHRDPNPPAGYFKPDFRIAPAVYETVDGITEETSPESFVLTFTGLPGKLYTVQHSPDLITWITLDGAVLCDGSPVEAGQPIGDGPSFFFRVTVADIDMDQDGLTDSEEHRLGTDPNNKTTVSGIPDSWLATHFTAVLLSGGLATIDPNADPDADGTSIAEEALAGTNPTTADPASARSWISVTGNGAENAAITRTGTLTIAAGQTAILVVATASAEYPTYTEPPSSEFNDLLEWSATPSQGDPIEGQIDVNSRHAEWEIDEINGTAITGLPVPAHIEELRVFTAPANAPLTIAVDVSATNIADGAYPSHVAVGLLRVEIQMHDSVLGRWIATDELKVAKWEEAWVSTGNFRNDFIDSPGMADVDRFRIQISGPVPADLRSVFVSSQNTSATEYNDAPTEVMLDDCPASAGSPAQEFVSKSLILVADAADNRFMTDNIINDQTHIVALGSDVEFRINGADGDLIAKIPVKIRGSVNITSYILTPNGQIEMELVGKVLDDISLVRQIYAQIGLEVTGSVQCVPTPTGVDLDDGLLLDTLQTLGTLEPEALALLNAYATPNDQSDVIAIYVNAELNSAQTPSGHPNGMAFPRGWSNADNFKGTVVIALQNHEPITLAHEVGHILLNGQGGNINNHYSETCNLMRTHVSYVGLASATSHERDTKRLTKEQDDYIFESDYIE